MILYLTINEKELDYMNLKKFKEFIWFKRNNGGDRKCKR